MLDRIFCFISGCYFIIYSFVILMSKKATIGVKHLNFENTGDLYILISIGMLVVGICMFYLAFRPKSHIKEIPEAVKCKK